METGRTVILLNMENLYEGLYDALNQVSTRIKTYNNINNKVFIINYAKNMLVIKKIKCLQ
jgi:CRISPR/Cas system-associated protein Csm6